MRSSAIAAEPAEPAAAAACCGRLAGPRAGCRWRRVNRAAGCARQVLRGVAARGAAGQDCAPEHLQRHQPGRCACSAVSWRRLRRGRALSWLRSAVRRDDGRHSVRRLPGAPRRPCAAIAILRADCCIRSAPRRARASASAAWTCWIQAQRCARRSAARTCTWPSSRLRRFLG